MLRSVLLSLLLSCSVSLGSSAVILDNGAPILWAQTSSQLSELPMLNGTVTPNPWNYLHRMSLIRLTIAATDTNMGFIGSSGTASPLWGLPLQLAWMLTSGRLADPTGASTCGVQTGDPMCISTQSWWGCVNYFSSVLPFLSAVQQGFMGAEVQVQLLLPEGEDFCTTYADCAARFPDAMSKWDAFYQGLKALVDSPLPEGVKKDTLLGLYWAAQMATSAGSSACSTRQRHYSSAETSFANSWVSTAEYVAAAHFQSSLENSAMFIKNLPGRVLKSDDRAPNIADLSQEENHTLSIFSWMSTINSILGGSLVRMWKSAMCSVTTREKGREMLGQLLLNPSFATSSLLTIITETSRSC
ncbi:protein LEG1 homolog [Takifugu flavidus]|uniref:protein LEG1 homolog n=1 Tax=Takifugu flavidus TaxID=433684 RepID=UPI002544D123|nr:protein LEG1 homolog [Takifugu flavidus]